METALHIDDAGARGNTHFIRMLLGYRISRSFAFGYVSFVLPLYLRFIGMSYIDIGIYALVATIASAALSTVSGFLGDFYGRRRMLILLSLLFPAMMMLLLTLHSIPDIFITSLLGVSFTGGIGGGSGGGPIAPLQTSLLADLTTDESRTRSFGLLMSGAVFAALAGSLFSTAVSAFTFRQEYFRILFLTGLVFSIASFLFIFLMKFSDKPAEKGSAVVPVKSAHGIGRIALSGLFGSVGLGLIMPFIPIWFSDIMHATDGQISVIYSLSYLGTAFAVLLATRVEGSVGMIRGITFFRGLSSVLLIAIPFSGSIAAAAALFVVRTGLYSMTIPLRQSFSMQLFDPSERARGAGITGIARRIPFGIAASLSGVLFAIGISALAFASAGLISIFDPVLYYFFFRRQG
ncbi:MAG: MFS transporter [Candidatus Thermoplasmatota archaeon]|jgi:MFS family permease|nr:MFS transporter [Candidatus Thermoplasmatota archaeon]